MNQIELYFSAVARRVLRHHDFSGRDDLVDLVDLHERARNSTSLCDRGFAVPTAVETMAAAARTDASQIMMVTRGTERIVRADSTDGMPMPR
ncbi:hypothetical protein ACIP79_12975 [Streptomyces sp. NPDC088747]|uniref:hypothetical protein n=1 Tax=Streptomyces sp. NPDC088747 TaxID=3365886 RepID=UPI00382CE298